MPKEITRIVAHKNVAACHNMQTLLTQDASLQVVAEASDGPTLQKLCQHHQPDLILFDHRSCAATDFRQPLPHLCPATKIVILTTLEAGCCCPPEAGLQLRSYILTDEPPVIMQQALQTVARGERWVSQRLLEQLMLPLPTLTSQEQALLALMARGCSNAEMAAELGLARQTVRNYVSRLYSTLGVTSRAEAVVWAINHGFD